VQCLCAQYNSCGCDEDTNTTALNTLVGDGSVDSNGLVRDSNGTLTAARVNGTEVLLVNGTLPNSTDSSTSGASNPASDSNSAAVATFGGAVRALGWAGVAAAVAGSVLLT
jgi:hypothetical protein